MYFSDYRHSMLLFLSKLIPIIGIYYLQDLSY